MVVSSLLMSRFYCSSACSTTQEMRRMIKQPHTLIPCKEMESVGDVEQQKKTLCPFVCVCLCARQHREREREREKKII